MRTERVMRGPAVEPPATVRELDGTPNLMLLYARAALPRPGRRWAGRGRGGPALPDVRLTRSKVTVDREHLAAYDGVCGFRVSDVLPATYPHVLAFPLAMAVMTQPRFPLPVVGLVHVRNRITQVRPLDAGEPLSLAAWAENLGPHEKGTQVDLVCQATSDAADGEVVWSGRSTYLHRRGRAPGDRSGSRPVTGAPPPAAVWPVPADSGRRYAAVSGDSNPIHLGKLTARMFGFPAAIAHGMWVKARCLAAFEGRLPDAFTVDVAFKLPVLLPARVTFSESPGPDGIAFAVHNANGTKPHLTGTVTAGS